MQHSDQLLRQFRTVLCWLIALVSLGGCTHSVSFKPYILARIEPRASATVIDGTIDEFRELVAKAQLPHNGIRARHELYRKAGNCLYSQLGSKDYQLIGEVYGGGSARASLSTLRSAFAEKAAASGGDVVLVFQQGVEERQYTHTTPGQASTYTYGTARSYGNTAQANVRSNTVYYPGTTYSGTMYLPHGNGLVFRYAPGIEAMRVRMDSLPDSKIERIENEFKNLTKDKEMSWDALLERWEELIIE